MKRRRYTSRVFSDACERSKYYAGIVIVIVYVIVYACVRACVRACILLGQFCSLGLHLSNSGVPAAAEEGR